MEGDLPTEGTGMLQKTQDGTVAVKMLIYTLTFSLALVLAMTAWIWWALREMSDWPEFRELDEP